MTKPSPPKLSSLRVLIGVPVVLMTKYPARAPFIGAPVSAESPPAGVPLITRFTSASACCRLKPTVTTGGSNRNSRSPQF